MLKLTRVQQKKLDTLAKQLPPVKYFAPANKRMLGKDIIDNDRIDKSKFVVIVPELTYMVSTKCEYFINHKSRIKQAFTSGGLQEVEKYCLKVYSDIDSIVNEELEQQKIIQN